MNVERWLDVDFDRLGACVPGHADEAGGGIDRAGRADGDESLAALQHGRDLIHGEWHLSEPDDVWAHADGPRARRAFVGDREFVLGGAGKAGLAKRAACFQDFAVHVDQPPAAAAAALVQVVNVLGDQREMVTEVVFEFSERTMRGIRLDLRKLVAAIQ